jgi:hypothetical protein
MMATIKGGNKFSKALQEMAGKIGKASSVRIGFLSGSTYPDGTPVAMVAAIQDWGAPGANIPPRPFFRNMIAAKKGEWPKAISDLLKANDYDALLTLQQTGQTVAGQLRESIQQTNSPPLKPATIRRKGFATPLIDTGQMFNSVDSEVKE